MAVVIYMVGLNYLNLPLFRRHPQRQLLGLSLNELIAQVNPRHVLDIFISTGVILLTRDEPLKACGVLKLLRKRTRGSNSSIGLGDTAIA